MGGQRRPAVAAGLVAAGLAAACFVAARVVAPAADPQQTPDIVLITLDDVGSNDLWDSTDLPDAVAPNIRSVAASGVRLTNYYGQAFCSPARAALLSGKFTHRTGFSRFESQGIELDAYSNWSVPLGAPLLPEALKARGYATHGIGKWNIGHCNELLMPWARGFESFAGYFTSGVNYLTHETKNFSRADGTQTQWRDLMTARKGEGVRNGSRYFGTHTTPLFTQFALDVLDDRDDRPLHLWLAYHAMHGNNGCDQVRTSVRRSRIARPRGTEILVFLPRRRSTRRRIPQRVAHQLSLSRRRFAAGLRAVDKGVGLVRGDFKSDRDYVLVVHSDNGASACSTDCAGSNAPLRGYKFTDFDGGTRVPCAVESSLLPAGGAARPTAVCHVTGAGGGASRDTVVFSLSAKHLSLRRGDYKLLVRSLNASWIADGVDPINWLEHHNGSMCPRDVEASFLFHAPSDPEERHNLFYDAAYADRVDEMTAFWRATYAAEYYVPSTPHLDYVAESPPASAAFDRNGGYVTHWGCGPLDYYAKANVSAVPNATGP
ncbi:sulfuric ester hydrolase [Aureococcus anophagefferens]|nr:sulfuric ester hydrolase [Aureococcus anophagefferens]